MERLLRRQGVFFNIVSTSLLFSVTFLSQTDPLNNILPRATALIRTPFAPNGREIPFTKPFNADFAAEYVTGAPEINSQPQIEETQTIDPFD